MCDSLGGQCGYDFLAGCDAVACNFGPGHLEKQEKAHRDRMVA